MTTETRYPWYDSRWHTVYSRTCELIRTQYPEKYTAFIEAFDPLRTRPNFTVQPLTDLFNGDTMGKISDIIDNLKKGDKKSYELRQFGRLTVHDHSFFTTLQNRITARVCEAVGEAVEPYYNFLSLYNNLGICGLHLDAPEAKWTVDLCIEQSQPWPIHISQVVPWPQNERYGDDWVNEIKNDPAHSFTPYTLEPGQAIIFSGSSQWHYRDRITKNREKHHCSLLFFHFIPAGTRKIVELANWARLFDLEEIAEIVTTRS